MGEWDGWTKYMLLYWYMTSSSVSQVVTIHSKFDLKKMNTFENDHSYFTDPGSQICSIVISIISIKNYILVQQLV